MAKASEKALFNSSYHWLIFGHETQPTMMQTEMPLPSPLSTPLPIASGTDSASAHFLAAAADVEHFERLNINMNSEIALVKPQQSYGATNTTPQWKIYDLYDVW